MNCGLRQGCILSLVLFNLYINDLALYLKALDIGINVGDDKICMLLYADDIVLLANNENELQILLSSLHVNDWCLQNDMSVNANKCNIVHFRTKSTSCSSLIRYASINKYLGLVLDEHLDYSVLSL